MSNSEHGRDNEKMEGSALLLCGCPGPELGNQSRLQHLLQSSQLQRRCVWTVVHGALDFSALLPTHRPSHSAYTVILTRKYTHGGKVPPAHTCAPTSTRMHAVCTNSGTEKHRSEGVEGGEDQQSWRPAFFKIAPPLFLSK